jgi:IS30 family transposase
MNTFTHFEFAERKMIEGFLNQNKSRRWIARRLGKSVSSVVDEVKRNSVKGAYTAKKADLKARTKRKYSKAECLKVVADPSLRRFVTENILADQSPEGISGRLREVEKEIEYASTKAIYKFVYSVHGRNIEKHLYSKSVHKKSGRKRDTPVTIGGRTLIDDRPKKVEKRLEFGHFEGDFIESGKEGKGSLLVLIERKTRYPFLRYLDDRTTASVNKAVADILLGIPVKSLTIDNDISFQKHEELSHLIEAEIFFCHPQSPHEKGTVENRNKAIRRYIKKRTDLSTVPREVLSRVENILRDKFMKCLRYRTPREEFLREMKKIGTKKTATCGMINDSILLAHK